MASYAAQAAAALRKITDKGAPVTFSRGAQSAYDPATDTWTGSAITPVVGVAVQVRGDPDRFVALNLVLVDPVTLLVAASGLTIIPRPGDLFVWDAVQYTIKDVDPTAPLGTNSTPILYRITGSK